MLAAPQNQVESYNKKCKDSCALMGTSSWGAPLVLVCSPLMKKVQQLKHSRELCFIDSSGNMDRENCRVFLLLTHSCSGGLPLDILLCQSEDEQKLELLKQIVWEWPGRTADHYCRWLWAKGGSSGASISWCHTSPVLLPFATSSLEVAVQQGERCGPQIFRFLCPACFQSVRLQKPSTALGDGTCNTMFGRSQHF